MGNLADEAMNIELILAEHTLKTREERNQSNKPTNPFPSVEGISPT
jgi:hypothetical protein